jgi:hypothetical protein
MVQKRKQISNPAATSGYNCVKPGTTGCWSTHEECTFCNTEVSEYFLQIFGLFSSFSSFFFKLVQVSRSYHNVKCEANRKTIKSYIMPRCRYVRFSLNIVHIATGSHSAPYLEEKDFWPLGSIIGVMNAISPLSRILYGLWRAWQMSGPSA